MSRYRPTIGDHVHVTIVGELVSYDDDLGVWMLKGHAAPESGGHIPWVYPLHWSTDFQPDTP